jgi:putative hemin transport protein
MPHDSLTHIAPDGAAATAPASDDPLWRRWQALRAEHPHLHARDAAARLGVSELELVACNPGSHRLDGDWGAVIAGLREVGPVLALTRNHGVVIEKTGPVADVDIYPEHQMGQVVGEHVDLRLFLRHWVHGYAVSDATPSGRRESLQVFDAAGVAVHKVHCVTATNPAGWAALMDTHAAAPTAIEIPAPAPPTAPTPDADIDTAGLRAAWLGMSSTHDFFGLLRRFGVERRQALRLAGTDLAQQVAANSYRPVLELARDGGLPLMLFVGNHGCVQIHTGPVHRVETVGQWFNVLDPDFNLHLWQPAVTDAWLVRKPTERGTVTSLECYDDAGEMLLQCFGKRQDDGSESPHWRELVGLATGIEDVGEVGA